MLYSDLLLTLLRYYVFCGCPNWQYERRVHAVPKHCTSLPHRMHFHYGGWHHRSRGRWNRVLMVLESARAGSRRAPRLRLMWSCRAAHTLRGGDLRVTPRPHPCGAVMGGPLPAGPGPPQAGPHIVPGLRLLWLQASSCGTDLRVTP